MTRRSDCPISNALDQVGDKWSLLILRDLLFFQKRTFSALQHSDEKMATNILSSRLENLEKSGFIRKQPDPSDRRKKIYTPTAKGKDMLPVLLEMIVWSSKHDPDTNAPRDFVDRAIHRRDALISDLLARMDG